MKRRRDYDAEMRMLQLMGDLVIVCLFVLAIGWGIVRLFQIAIGLG